MSCYCNKIPNTKQLQGGGTYLGSQIKGTSCRRSPGSGAEAAGHITSSAGRESEGRWCWLDASFLIHPVIPVHGWCQPHWGQGFPPSLVSGKHPHRHLQQYFPGDPKFSQRQQSIIIMLFYQTTLLLSLRPLGKCSIFLLVAKHISKVQRTLEVLIDPLCQNGTPFCQFVSLKSFKRIICLFSNNNNKPPQPKKKPQIHLTITRSLQFNSNKSKFQGFILKNVIVIRI